MFKAILSLPAVSDKGFLITIGDRSVTGLVARDQMIGANQVPCFKCRNVTMSDIGSSSGQVITMGERPCSLPLQIQKHQQKLHLVKL